LQLFKPFLLEAIHRLIEILRDLVVFIRKEQIKLTTIAKKAGVSYSGLVRNIKLTPSDEKLPLQETILDYIYKIEQAFPELVAKMPQRVAASIGDIVAKKLQANDSGSPLFTRAILEIVLEEIQDLKAILEDIRKGKTDSGPRPYDEDEPK
jgi:hypothetical protein